MKPLDDVFARLHLSPFRRRFRLGEKEQRYLQDKGLEIVLSHAADFVSARLGAAQPANDGKQTPMRGHPVFIAQHATATCCRGCLAKWHAIPSGQALAPAEQHYIVNVIRRWLVSRPAGPSAGSRG